MEMRQQHFPAQHVLVRQGEKGGKAWLIESGTLEVLLSGPEGTQRLNVLGRNAIIGEMALIDGGPRSATVRTLEPVVCREITRDAFNMMIERSLPLAASILKSLVRAIRSAYKLPPTEDDLFQDPPPQRPGQLKKLNQRRLQHFRPHETIFYKGESATTAYLLRSGSVRIHRNEIDMRVIIPGQIFGELALLNARPRVASATALESTVCELIKKLDFDEAIASMPPILRAMTRIYIAQLEPK